MGARANFRVDSEGGTVEDGAVGFVGGVEECTLGVKVMGGVEDLELNGIRFVALEVVHVNTVSTPAAYLVTPAITAIPIFYLN